MRAICIIGALMLFCFSFQGIECAEESAAPTTVVVIVNGLVCDFCARTIEKTLHKQPEIAKTEIDLSSKKITLTMNPGRDIADAELTDLIQNAGYGVERVVRE